MLCEIAQEVAMRSLKHLWVDGKEVKVSASPSMRPRLPCLLPLLCLPRLPRLPTGLRGHGLTVPSLPAFVRACLFSFFFFFCSLAWAGASESEGSCCAEHSELRGWDAALERGQEPQDIQAGGD